MPTGSRLKNWMGDRTSAAVPSSFPFLFGSSPRLLSIFSFSLFLCLSLGRKIKRNIFLIPIEIHLRILPISCQRFGCCLAKFIIFLSIRDLSMGTGLMDDAKCALNESGPSTNRPLIVLNVSAAERMLKGRVRPDCLPKSQHRRNSGNCHQI